MNLQRFNFQTYIIVAIEVIFVPLLCIVCARYILSAITLPSSTPSYVIDLDYQSFDDEPGVPDRLVGKAPPNMDLAIYLNDRLLDIAHANNKGDYSITLPVLPERRNSLVALPTEIDSSTLPIFYLPNGFQRYRYTERASHPSAPFLAFANWTDDGLHVYGSTEAESEIEIYTTSCEKNAPHFNTESDGEGNFHGVILGVENSNSSPEHLCSRIRYEQNQDWVEHTLELSEDLFQRELQRSIHLVFSQTGMKVTFSVQMPTGYKIYQNLAKGDIGELEFIEYMFGRVLLNTYVGPDQISWRQEKQADAESVLILLESTELQYLIPEDEITTFRLDTTTLSQALPPYTSQDRLTINLDSVRVISSDPPPVASTPERYLWIGTIPENKSIDITVSRGSGVTFDHIQRMMLKDTLSALLSNISVTPNSLFEQTIEGELVGILPSKAPAPAQSQVYKYYRALYLADPLLTVVNPSETLRSFIRNLPFRLPNSVATILFGSLWLIPSGLALWVVRKQQSRGGRIRIFLSNFTDIAWGTAILIFLGFNWLPLVINAGITRDDYIAVLVSAYANLLLFSFFMRRFDLLAKHRLVRALLFSTLLSIVVTGLVSTILIFIPEAFGSALLTGLSLLIFCNFTWQALQINLEKHPRPATGLLGLVVLVIIIVSLPIQDLPTRAQLSGFIGVTTQALGKLLPLFPFGVLAGISVALWKIFDKRLGTSQKQLERDLGRLAFVAFAVGFSPAWGFIPVSVIVSLILYEWLVPQRMPASTSQLDQFIKYNQGQAISALLDLNRELRLWHVIENDLQKQVREGKIKTEEYEAQLKRHEDKYQSLLRPEFLAEFDSNVSVKDLAFNFGIGPRYRDNMRQALAWGMILLIPLTLIHAWPLVSTEIQNALPFPFLHIGSRLGVFIGQFLAMAVFAGYFFPNLRGRNGLEKGGWLAGMVVFSLLPAQLLMADSTIDLMALIVWAGTILAYNLLLGLLAFDLRTLSERGYRWNRLTDLYNFRELAVYLTGSGAPLVTTIVSVVAGNLEELVPAILRVVFPTVNLSNAQNELLQVLLDLASKLTAKALQ